MPRDTKENKSALQKQSGKIRNGLDIETIKMDRRKGNAVTHSRLTIDTAPVGMLRIIKNRDVSAVRKTQMPQISPETQQNARAKRASLRNRCGKLGRKFRAKIQTPSQKKRKSACLCKK